MTRILHVLTSQFSFNDDFTCSEAYQKEGSRTRGLGLQLSVGRGSCSIGSCTCFECHHCSANMQSDSWSRKPEPTVKETAFWIINHFPSSQALSLGFHRRSCTGKGTMQNFCSCVEREEGFQRDTAMSGQGIRWSWSDREGIGPKEGEGKRAHIRQELWEKHAFASTAMSQSHFQGFSGKFWKGSNRAHLKVNLKSEPSLSKPCRLFFLFFQS